MLDPAVLGTLDKQRDPHRRWLRRTYQEGPGFRFLATRGGRPPKPEPRRSALDLVRGRAKRLRVMKIHRTRVPRDALSLVS